MCTTRFPTVCASVVTPCVEPFVWWTESTISSWFCVSHVLFRLNQLQNETVSVGDTAISHHTLLAKFPFPGGAVEGGLGVRYSRVVKTQSGGGGILE